MRHCRCSDNPASVGEGNDDHDDDRNDAIVVGGVDDAQNGGT